MSSALPKRRFTSPATTNFHYSFLFLPRQKRAALEAVHAFARRGDDIVDGGLEPERARQEIAHYRQDLDACYEGRGTTPELAALAESVQRYRIPRRHFDDLILGFEMDLVTARYLTFEELAVYCHRVAATIGLISIEIFGYRNPRVRDYAVNLGTALQLVNIMRDVQSDGERGRLYLPQEDLDRFGLRSVDIMARRYNDSFIELMQLEYDRACHYFSLARQMLPPEERRSMIAAESMAAIYWQVLKRIQLRCYNVFGERVRLSQPLKLWTALTVYLGIEWYK
jgi:phytoene synthase